MRTLALEALTLLDRLLDELPAKVREAFLLSHLQGLKIAEIAERLQVSTRSVKLYLVRANQHCFLRSCHEHTATGLQAPHHP